MGSSRMSAVLRSAVLSLVIFGITKANENAFSRLIDDLFHDSNYEKDAIPMIKPADDSNENALNVAVGLTVISLDLDPTEIMSATTWLRTQWNDFRLAWDPAEYQGLEAIKIPPSRIWKPDLSVYNAADFGSGSFADMYASSNSLAIVYNTGRVLWIPPMHMKVHCNKGHGVSDNVKDEDEECSIKIGSWTYDGFHLNLTAYNGKEVLELGDMSRNSPYVVTSQQGNAIESKFYSCCPEPYMSVNYRFTVQKAYTIQDGEKVFSKSPEDLEQLYEQYQTTFYGNK